MPGSSRCGSRQQGRSITRRISKKDAGAFLKAVKRYGRIERMADIAQEVGSVLQDQPATARFDCLPGWPPKSKAPLCSCFVCGAQ